MSSYHVGTGTFYDSRHFGRHLSLPRFCAAKHAMPTANIVDQIDGQRRQSLDENQAPILAIMKDEVL